MRLRALKPFSDKNPGDVFVTDWSHADELVTDGLAERADDADVAEPAVPRAPLSLHRKDKR